MKKFFYIFIFSVIFLCSFSDTSFEVTKNSNVKLNSKAMQENVLSIEKLITKTIEDARKEFESVPDAEELEVFAYDMFLAVKTTVDSTRHEITKIHFTSPQKAELTLKISIPDADKISDSEEFKEFFSQKYFLKTGKTFPPNFDNSDSEASLKATVEVYSATIESLYEYLPYIKNEDYISTNVTIHAVKTENEWKLEDPIF